jgi:hypothetical protein
MQDHTTRVISAWSMEAFNGHILEQAAFHTQIPIYLCRHVAKILLHSYLQEPSPPTVSWFYNSSDHHKICQVRS